MIWLASYPRSGNTLVRTILNDCFDIVAGSKYDETQGNPPLRELIGLERGLDSDIRKTHDLPEDNSPAIYIVRDGRAAIVSYFHFLKRYAQPVAMDDIIRGDVCFGSWSDHYKAWNPKSRPHTMLLKFEDIVTSSRYAIDKLADFSRRRHGDPSQRHSIHAYPV